MGTFKAHDGEYFLEPLMKTDGGEHEDEHNKPHLIYRHEEINRKYQKSHKPCEVSGIVPLSFSMQLFFRVLVLIFKKKKGKLPFEDIFLQIVSLDPCVFLSCKFGKNYFFPFHWVI